MRSVHCLCCSIGLLVTLACARIGYEAVDDLDSGGGGVPAEAGAGGAYSTGGTAATSGGSGGTGGVGGGIGTGGISPSGGTTGSGGTTATGGNTGLGGTSATGGDTGLGGTGGGVQGTGGDNGCDPSLSAIARLVVHDTNLTRAALWAIKTDFQIGMSGAHPWGDWRNSYFASCDSRAMALLGKEWIAVAAESKQYTGGPQATITLNCERDLYMLVDDRWGITPSWTAGWTKTTWKLYVWESTSRPSLPFTVYARLRESGSIDLPMIGFTTAYNYVIVVD